MRRIKSSLLKSVGLCLALFVFSLFDLECNNYVVANRTNCCGKGLLTLMGVQKLEAKEGDSKIGKFRQHFEKEKKEEEGKKKEKKEEKNVVKNFFKYFKEKEPKKEAYTPPVSRYYPDYYYNYINNVRFSPGGAILRERSKVPLALTYADIEQNKVALSYHYGRDKEDELRLYNYALGFGLWNYGGLGVSHFKIKEGEGEDYSSLSTTDIFFKGQFTKSQYKRASLGITLGLKTLNFSALDDSGEREHLNTLGLGIGGTLSFPFLRYFIGHGMISASSIEGLSLIDYEYGASLQLAPNVNLDLSYRALQIPAATLGGVRFGMEYKF